MRGQPLGASAFYSPARSDVLLGRAKELSDMDMSDRALRHPCRSPIHTGPSSPGCSHVSRLSRAMRACLT